MDQKPTLDLVLSIPSRGFGILTGLEFFINIFWQNMAKYGEIWQTTYPTVRGNPPNRELWCKIG